MIRCFRVANLSYNHYIIHSQNMQGFPINFHLFLHKKRGCFFAEKQPLKKFHLFYVAIACSVLALFRIWTTDAVLTPFFHTIQIQADAANHQQKNCNYNNIRHKIPQFISFPQNSKYIPR